MISYQQRGVICPLLVPSLLRLNANVHKKAQLSSVEFSSNVVHFNV